METLLKIFSRLLFQSIAAAAVTATTHTHTHRECMYVKCLYATLTVYIRTCRQLHMYIHTYIQADRQTYIHIYRQTCIYTYIHTDIHTYLQAYRQTYMHTDTHTYRQTDSHIHILKKNSANLYVCMYERKEHKNP